MLAVEEKDNHTFLPCKETEDLGLGPDEPCFFVLFNHCALQTICKSYHITSEKTLCMRC